jgi:hypothetical protein
MLLVDEATRPNASQVLVMPRPLPEKVGLVVPEQLFA